MSTVAELLIKLGMDSTGMDSGMSSSRSKLQDWGDSLKSAGTKLTAGVTVPLAGAGLMAINWASALEQAEGKSEAVFGDSAQSVKDWAHTTAGSYGFAASESLAMASTYGSLFKVMGQTNEVSADQSMALIGLSADMAAFNDVSNERASQALMAGLTGEYMSLRSMGVFLNEAAVSQEALTIAQADGREEVTDADKVQARYNLILKQTAQQQGQAARESKNWSSRIPQLRAKLKDLGATLGARLMPYALRFLDWIDKAIQWFAKLSPKVQGIILVLAALAAAIGPVLLALGFMLPALGAIGAAIGIVLSPIGLLVIAIAALIGLGIYAWVNDLWGFRDAVSAVTDGVVAFAKGLDALRKYIQAVLDDGDTLNDWLTHLPKALRPIIQGIGDFVNNLADFAGSLGLVRDQLSAALDALIAGNWSEALDQFATALGTLGIALADLSADTLTALADGMDNLAKKAGPLDWAVSSLASSLRHGADALRSFSGAISAVFAGDYDTSIRQLAKGFGDLAIASLDAQTAVAKAMAGIIRSIAPAASLQLNALANDMRRVASEGGPMARTLTVAATSIDQSVTAIDRARSAYSNFKNGNYGAMFLDLGNAMAALVLSAQNAGMAVVAAVGDIGKAILDRLVNSDLAGKIKTGVVSRINNIRIGVADFASLAMSTGTSIANAIRTQIDGWSGATVKNALTSAINRISAAAGDFASLAGQVGNGIAGAIRDQIGSWSGDTVKSALTAAINAIAVGAGDLAGIGKSIADAIWEAIKTAATSWDWKGLVPDWVPGNSKMVADRSAGAAQAQQAAFGKNDMSSLGGGAPAGGGDTFTAIAGAATTAASSIATAASSIAASMARATSATQLAGTTITSVTSAMASAVTMNFTRIGSVVSSTTMQANSTAQSGFQQMRAAIQTATSAAASAVQSGMSQIRSTVQSAASAVSAAGQQAGSGFRSGIQSGMQGAVSATHSAVSQIRGAVSGISLSGQGYSIGASLGQGIASGIQAYIGSVANAAASLVSNAIAAARSAAASHSPSKKMMELGADMAEGMTIGLDRGAASVAAATAALVDIPSAMTQMATGATANTGQPVYVSISLKSQELIDLIRNAEDGGGFARDFGQQLGLYGGMP